ncbi:MAG: ABC transporter permease subunit [Verrucomicrobiota bacterium]
MSVVFEGWGGGVRRVFARGAEMRGEVRMGEGVEELWRKRGRSRLLRGTGVLLVGGVVASWLGERDWGSGVSWVKRRENLERFFGELVPYPVQESGHWGEVWRWLEGLLFWEGLDAVWRTLHLGTAAILLAGVVALVGVFLGARSLATGEPRGVRMGGGLWRGVGASLVRGLAMVGRSMPEFILAFVLLQVFGPTVWALMFALAIHNGGILVRLGAEVMDNLEEGGERVMLAEGGSRVAAFLGGMLPTGFNRLVLFLLYRWETSIREATVLGMLGVGSLGFLISEARVRLFYDEMLLWVLLGAGLVFLGDLGSDWVRGRRRARGGPGV